MSVRRTIENNEEAGIRPSKTYQSFIAAARGHQVSIGYFWVYKIIFWVDSHRSVRINEKDYRGLYANNNSPLVYLAHHEEDSKQIKRYKGHAEIEQEMSQVVWNSHTKDLFDRNWNDFLLKYGLVDNKWLSDLYEDRHIWVLIYLDHHFWAGIRSTQRSESMHSFFNKFITRNSSLIQFVKQYDNYIRNREQAERESDAADFHTVIPCATKSSIKAQFQHVYTHQKFRKVQAQFREKANCITRLTNYALGYSVYEVGEQVCSSIFNKFVVTYDSVAAEVKCQCLLFESRGILCYHALSVLSFERVTQVSPRYILERWSKKVKRRHTHIKSSHDEPLLEPRSKRFDELVFHSQNICEFASKSELTAILDRAYNEVMVEMEELKAKRKGTCSLSHEDANLESINELQIPPRVRTRGHPKNRLGSKLDKQIANASKKKKTKALNELNLFDAASVVHPNSSQYQGRVMNYQFRKPAAVDSFLGV
ncbi:Protein FAR-RED ELONGATED HYPOCOTYL [Arachis hypogaea]|nr:Protein FAR-RED ELONGATED HYPOCOTYL [Arachis hypogaea]